MNWEEHRRMAVACAECGAVFVAMERKDGTIRPIGGQTSCSSCGNGKFRELSGQILGNTSSEDTAT